MPIPCYKIRKILSPFLLLRLLLINFFNNQLIQSQTLISPNFDQSLLPFGSLSLTGILSSHCNGNKFNSEASFTILNNCSFTVWSAAIPGGGRRLDSLQTWVINVPSGTTGGRIWGRTNCSFDDSGNGNCETGDCVGVLQCRTNGSPPNTLAEFALNQVNDLDYFDLSVVEGFNIPMEFRPRSNKGCSRGARCAADIKEECPTVLRAAGGCNNPCTVFKTAEYCCTNNNGSCGPTDLSKFFKERCPDVYSYPMDGATSTLTCPTGTNYDVVFCPS